MARWLPLEEKRGRGERGKRKLPSYPLLLSDNRETGKPLDDGCLSDPVERLKPDQPVRVTLSVTHLSLKYVTALEMRTIESPG